MIQIPFRDHGIIIDVNFLLLEDPVASLFTMKYMLENHPDLSIQGLFMNFNVQLQALELNNYFMIQLAERRPTACIFKTDGLQRIHATFGHPSVLYTQKCYSERQANPQTSKLRKRYRKFRNSVSFARRMRRTLAGLGLQWSQKNLDSIMPCNYTRCG